MNSFEFILILTSMVMAFPKRGKKASKCFIRVLGALSISKFFQAMIAYYTRNNNISK